MSKNAVALIDCNNRETLLQFLIEQIDSKAAKNEMVSPYDDQLIGKMNFRHGGMEHSMFFTFAKANEYPKMSFRGYKIIYASLDVSESSSQVLTEMCQYFGGYLNHNDDLEVGFERIERTRPISIEEENEEKEFKQAEIEKERQLKELQMREAKETKEVREKESKEIKEAREVKEEREVKPVKEKKYERKEKVERVEKQENQNKNELRSEKNEKGQRSEKGEHKPRNFHKGRNHKSNQGNRGNQQHKQQNQTDNQTSESK